MKRLFLFLFLALAFTGRAGDKFEGIKTRCTMCGMNSARSETPYLITYKDGTKRLACGINCAVMFKEKEPDVVSAQARDTFSKSWFDIEQGFYVNESAVTPKGTMYPFVWPFASEKDAREFAKKKQGVVLNFSEVYLILPCSGKKSPSGR